VDIFHYEPGRPELISHTYCRNIPESIIDYSDTLSFKFKCAGIHDTRAVMAAIMLRRTDIEVMTIIKQKFNSVGLKGINTFTVKIIREETIRSLAHRDYNSL
jgi:predicted restriction endonuclease